MNLYEYLLESNDFKKIERYEAILRDLDSKYNLSKIYSFNTNVNGQLICSYSIDYEELELTCTYYFYVKEYNEKITLLFEEVVLGTKDYLVINFYLINNEIREEYTIDYNDMTDKNAISKIRMLKESDSQDYV